MDEPLTYDFGVGGYDIEFDCPDLSDQAVMIRSNIAVTVADAATSGSGANDIIIGNSGGSGGYYYVSVEDMNGYEVEKYFTDDLLRMGRVRVVFHNEFATIYVDERWVYTFSFEKVYIPDVVTLALHTSGGSITVTNIRKKELSDWREAIFIDMETTSQNAISSVVLQRPLDPRTNYEGDLVFEYEPVRSYMAVMPFVRKHNLRESESSQAASDAIVYFTRAAVVIDETFLNNYGFVTRMYRLPDLDNGAIHAAKIMQNKARQRLRMHTVTGRWYPEYELQDRARISTYLTGTGTLDEFDISIESISLSISEGEASMQMTGRDING